MHPCVGRFRETKVQYVDIVLVNTKTHAHTHTHTHAHTVNRAILVVKIFSDSMDSAKIKRTKIMRIINDNAERGRLSENYLT